MLTLFSLRTPLVGPVSMEVPAGQCIGLSGPSGAGKSLLLRAIADLDPSEGGVHLDGTDRADIAAPEWRRRVALVPANSGWWAPRVGDHFLEVPEDLEPLFEAVGLPEAQDWEVARLSTGERQRLALVRALMRRPDILLLDEPTGALDPAAAARVETVLGRCLGQGIGILLVTHDPGQAKRLCDDILQIEAGKLRERAA